jgi:hypothetical protein
MTNIKGSGRTQDLPGAADCSHQSVVHIPNPDRISYIQLLYLKHLQLHRRGTIQKAVKCPVLYTPATITILKCEYFMP